MKKSFKIFAILVISYFVGNTIVKTIANKAIEKAVEPLIQYYNATEALLDTLEMHYHWVDAVENYDYYDAVEALYDNNLLVE